MKIRESRSLPPTSRSLSSSPPARSAPLIAGDGFDTQRAEPVALDGAGSTKSAGDQVVELARSVMGQNAHDLKLANSTALGAAMQDWVADNVNCANFVSGLLIATGALDRSQGSAGVGNLVANLRRDPRFVETDLDHAQPGDVVAFSVPRRDGTTGAHVVVFQGRDELGRPKFIGSNNVNADGSQRVSESTGVPAGWRVTAVMHDTGTANPSFVAPGPGASPSPSQSAGALLSRGSSGPAVADLQQQLAAAGFDPGPIDGKFGPLTQAAVRAFQSARGLEVDGIVGPQTRAALSAAPVTAPEPPSTPAPAPAVPGTGLERLPPRDPSAMTGSQFLQATAGLSRAAREEAILREVLAGNVPESSRQFKELTVNARAKDGTLHEVKLRVIPDYVQIGSDADSVRIPMSPVTAQKIADATGTSLPTRKIVDEVYRQADVKVAPQPLPAGAQMMSNDYTARHDAKVDAQLAGVPPGALIAGDKKDLLISPAMESHPGRVIIYGWHQQNGKPIQPLSWIHESSYADYSHGVRLVGGTVSLDGREVPLAEVLRDPNLAPLLSDEGPLRSTRFPG